MIDRPVRGYQFIAMDALRGVAAIAVIMYHASALFTSNLRMPSAYLAVDFFFILSGFVIAFTNDGRLAQGLSAGDFMKRRLIRLYPMYFLGIMLGLAGWMAQRAVSGVHSGSAPIVSVGFSLFMLPTPDAPSEHIFPLDVPCWSLFFELVANAVFATGWRWLGGARLVILLAAAAVALVACGLLWGNLNIGWNWATFFGGLFRVMFGFFAGVLIQRSSFKFRQAKWGYVVFPALIVAIFARNAPEHSRLLFDLVAVLLVFPLTILWAANAPVAKCLQATFRLLGEVSYPIYVIHAPLLFFFAAVLARLTHEAPAASAPWAGICFVLLVLAVAIPLNKLYDSRVRRYLTNLIMPRTMAQGATVGSD